MRWLFIVFLFYVNLSAQNEKALIEVQSAVDTALITIGDRISYSITIDHKEGLRIEKPGAGVNLGQFEIKNYRISEPEVADGRVKLEYRYEISVYDTGKFVIPPFPVAYFPTDSLRDYKLIEAAPITIYVESVIQDTTRALIDIRDPINVPFDYVFMAMIIVIVMALSTGVFFAYRFYKKRKEAGYLFKAPAPPEPAHVIALRMLDQLHKKDLLAKGEIKQFYTELANIMRQYLENRFFIAALEETSFEIITDMRNQEISEALLELLTGFLELADLVKFAKYIPADSDNIKSMEDVRVFIEQTMISMVTDQESERTEMQEVTLENNNQKL